MTTDAQPNPNGGTVVLKAEPNEAPVYLRNFGNVIYLVDADGKQLGSQEFVELSPFAPECVQTVTVKLAHQGFWTEPFQSLKEMRRRPQSSETNFRASASERVSKMEATTAELREELGNTAAVAADGSDELEATGFFGRFLPSEKQEDAMRIVIRLINARAITLEDDEYRPGEQRFRRQKIKHGNVSAQSADGQPATEPESVTSIHGEAMSFALDPLEQAIESTTRVLRDEHEHLAHIGTTLSGDVPPSPVYKRMSNHLEALLAAQLKRVTGHE